MAVRLLERRAKVWLFHLKHVQGEKGRLSSNVIREVLLYLVASLQLPYVTSTFLRFFDCNNYVWEPEVLLKTEIKCNESSSWMVLEDGRLFTSGGRIDHYYKDEKFEICSEPTVWNTAYILGRDGAVKELPNMVGTRSWHGLIQVLKEIYVFGGCKL